MITIYGDTDVSCITEYTHNFLFQIKKINPKLSTALLFIVLWIISDQMQYFLNPCTALHEITRVRSRSTNLLAVSVVVLSSSF